MNCACMQVTRTPHAAELLKGQLVRLAGSSDSAVTDYNPWVGLYAAVRHQTVLGTPYDQRENLTIAEALRMYTRGSAYVTFEEGVMGSLESGKYADFVVVDKDVLTQPTDELKDVKARDAAGNWWGTGLFAN